MSYRAPLEDFRFLFDSVLDADRLTATERYADVTGDLRTAILEEAGRLAGEVLAPLQRAGDRAPAHLENGIVRTSPGFAEGYRAIAEGGWVGMTADPANGGMGLPVLLGNAVNEMMNAACISLALNPLLTQGQIEALEHHASDEIRALYLPKLISGRWSGTMNLTEPQAGSDVGALTTRAEPNGDGTYAITGQKIYITWGDGDFLENVCHLVLARLPEGVPGTKGISLFLVPKFIPDSDGAPGRRNTLQVLSLEHKLGMHGSPTATMNYDRATGWLVGEPHAGMRAMFTMMNNARLGVGTQGVGVAEAALQRALDYARERRQGAPLHRGGQGTIIDHADVRRMLAGMRTRIFAARAIAADCALSIDMARATGTAEWQSRAAFLTPIAKAFGTDTGIEVAQEGLQIHGGMGFIEETGAAQLLRDVRVTAIYEGTNGIQAMDLVSRKLADGGTTAMALIDEVSEAAARSMHLPGLGAPVAEAAERLRKTTETLLAAGDLNDRFAGAVAYLRAFALVLGAGYHLRAALAAGNGSARAALARLFILRLLPAHAALCSEAEAGADDLFALSPDDFAA